MLLRMAWRNIWRNKRRTLINVAALAAGVMAIVTAHSFREVANEEMFRSVTRGLVGHVQIHGRGYQASPEIDNLVRDPVVVETEIARLLPEATVERRVVGGGLAGSGDASSAAMVLGIDPANPAARSLLTIERGRPLSPSASREAVLGSGLARELKIEPGGELVLVGQAADGSLANDRFTVVGTADSGSSEANASSVFLCLADAQSFFGLGGGVHSLVVRLPCEREDLSPEAARLRGALDASGLETLTWSDILPELKSAVDAKRKNSRLIDFVVFLIVSLGILNTMTMATFERTREFGVLASLGTRRRRILGMVVLESLMQGLVGFALGLGLAICFLYGLGEVGLAGMMGDGGNADMLGARLPHVVALSVYPPAVVSAALTTLLTMLAGGLFPAIRASRLKPVEATRYV